MHLLDTAPLLGTAVVLKEERDDCRLAVIDTAFWRPRRETSYPPRGNV